MDKCIILSRVSTMAQDLQQQTDKLVEQALNDGFLQENIIIIEDKESGIKLSEEERLGLNKLKDAIVSDKSITTVYVYELSRISRRSAVNFSIREFLINHNIQMICLNPFFKMLNDDGTVSEASSLMFGIFTVNAENEMAIKRARFKRGIERKKQLGLHHTGKVLFGYDVDKEGRFILHQQNWKAVKECFDMYLTGKYSTRGLGIELMNRGLLSCNSEFTAKNNVQNILHNEEYTGKTGKPQIITQQQFDQVVEMMKKNRNSEYRTERTAICKGLLIDREKGYKLTYNHAGKSYFNTQRRCICVSCSVVDHIVWNYAMDEHQRYHSMDKTKLIDELEKQKNEWKGKMFTADGKIFELRQQIDDIEERLILRKISLARAEQLEQKLNDAITLQEKLSETAKNKLNEIAQRYAMLVMSDAMKYDYDKMTLEEQCKIVNEVIEKIYCWKPKRTELCIEIHNKLAGEIFVYHINSFHKNIISAKRSN